jgi:hypothetical protein
VTAFELAHSAFVDISSCRRARTTVGFSASRCPPSRNDSDQDPWQPKQRDCAKQRPPSSGRATRFLRNSHSSVSYFGFHLWAANNQSTLPCNVQGDGVRQILYGADLAPSLRPQLQAIVLGVQKEEVKFIELIFLVPQYQIHIESAATLIEFQRTVL